MTIKTVRQYPDEMLRKRARRVEVFDERLSQLAIDLRDTLYHHDGIGLAAPQLGVSLRVLIALQGDGHDGCITLVNPRIVSLSSMKSTEREGCLSLGGVWCPVTRPTWIAWRAQDITGKDIEGEADGWLARTLMHEIDHLDGVLISDYLSRKKQQQLRRRGR
ncbi:peptide deformylase [Photorhabdus viridis]|uniref:peptide deformylase n=1 Tax=Photorhabdus viridis TaxID=3163327 RepID=UPI0033077D30